MKNKHRNETNITQSVKIYVHTAAAAAAEREIKLFFSVPKKKCTSHMREWRSGEG